MFFRRLCQRIPISHCRGHCEDETFAGEIGLYMRRRGGEVALLARRWEQGVKGIVENVVDGMNFDGKYSHLSE